MVGIKIRPTQEELEDDSFYDNCIYLDGGDMYLRGNLLAEGEYELEDDSFSLDALTELFKAVAEEEEVDVSEVKLYFGTRGC
jgi:hypothetical protein